MTTDLACSPWRLSWRADPDVRALADRHYNRQKIGAPQFVPPGRCLVLKTADRSAAWITSWPFAEYAQHARPGAWMNSLFRNEGGHLSSDLIRWAVAHTRAKWPEVPPLGTVSFVDASKTEDKEVPGWCYRLSDKPHSYIHAELNRVCQDTAMTATAETLAQRLTILDNWIEQAAGS
jgi:hypothetical protein